MKTEFEAGRGTYFAKVMHEFRQSINLARAGLVMGEITNEADSDCDFVQAITCEVTSLDLSSPAVADLNLAVA